jgi:hypothetical protein
MTSSLPPFIVITRALRSAMLPRGLSFDAVIDTSSRAGSYAGFARAVSRAALSGRCATRAVESVPPAGRLRRSESARAVESRMSESARGRS